MFIIWKGRGILTPVYLIALLIGAYHLNLLIDDYVENFNPEIGFLFILGAAFILSGLLTYLTSRTYIIQDDVKIRVKAKHSFFFIPMKVWSILKYIIGALVIILGLYTIFK